MDEEKFLLAGELHGHGNMVRAVAASEDGFIATASRDNSCKIWELRDSGAREVVASMEHSHFVSAVCWLPASSVPGLESGGLVTAGFDKLVRVWRRGHYDEPLRVIAGHEDVVSSIAVSPDGETLVTGSWDKTAAIWSLHTGVATARLEGHSLAVWAVLVLPSDGSVITAAADKAIIHWSADGTLLARLEGHEDVVRRLVHVPSLGLLSCANDGMVRLWDLNAKECLHTYVTHDTYVYSLTVIPVSNDIVTCSEDCSVKIWRDGACLQAIEHPSVVWDAAVVPYQDGFDIVTACGDGVARVWTRNPNRAAALDVREAYDDVIKQMQLSKSKMAHAGLDVKKLPTKDRLRNPGTHDGERVFIREDGLQIGVYIWAAASSSWEKLGNVVDPPSSNSRAGNVLNGVTYDYVFDVDLGDDQPMRHLGHNEDDNPWLSAQRFLQENELPKHFLREVAMFIVKNTKSDFVLGEQPDFSSPKPTTSSHSIASAAPRDPAAVFLQNAKAQQKANGSHFPVTTPVSYPSQQFADKLEKKVFDINETLACSDDTGHHTFVEAELFGAMMKLLENSKFYHASNITEDMVVLVLGKLVHWPAAFRFPALDVLRRLLVHPKAGKAIAATGLDVVDILLSDGLQADLPRPAQMLGLQAYCNLFRFAEFHGRLLDCLPRALESIAGMLATSMMAPAVTAAATVLLNYAVQLLPARDKKEHRSACLAGLVSLAKVESLVPECVYRLLVAIGTLLYEDSVLKAEAEAAQVPALVAQLSSVDDERVQASCALVAAEFA